RSRLLERADQTEPGSKLPIVACDLQGWDSTATAETEPGPPRLWASPMLAPATCILPARPSSWSWTLLIIRMPEEPMGWPQDLSPPDVFTGNEPPSLVSPACTARQPLPGSQKPRSSQYT